MILPIVSTPVKPVIKKIYYPKRLIQIIHNLEIDNKKISQDLIEIKNAVKWIKNNLPDI